jgi:hypothetical protein
LLITGNIADRVARSGTTAVHAALYVDHKQLVATFPLRSI